METDTERARAPVGAGGVIVVALGAIAMLASLPTPALLTVLVLGGGIAGMAFTRRGSRGRFVAQALLGLLALALGVAALAALGLSIAVAVQIARGHDNGFGGLAVIVGLPLGIGLGLGALTVASLALGGPRRRTRAADGLIRRDPPAFP